MGDYGDIADVLHKNSSSRANARKSQNFDIITETAANSNRHVKKKKQIPKRAATWQIPGKPSPMNLLP
jgi:hypothetical protein